MTATTAPDKEESEDEPKTVDDHPIVRTENLLGVDGGQHVHYYSAVQHTIVVCKHREIIHERELPPGGPLEEWLDKMEERFGEWGILHYVPEREPFSRIGQRIANGIGE